MSSSADLPHGWAVARLGNLGDWGSGGTPSKSNKAYYESGTIPWLVIGDLNESVVYRSNLCITEEGLKNSSAKLLPTGTLLVAMYGSIGKTAITGVQCATNQAIAYCQPHEGINLNYLHRIMQWLKPNLIVQGKGGTQQNISQGILKNISVPLAPSNEQRRIADKLDRVLARVDAANEHLSRVGPLLKRFRQVVLDSAVSGVLTADWRAKHGCQSGWPDVSLGGVLTDIRYGTSKKCFSEKKGVPVLRIPNVGEGGEVVVDELKYAEFDESELASFVLRRSDLLLIRSNGSPGLVGRSCLVGDAGAGFVFAGYLIRLRPNLDVVDPDFLNYVLRGTAVRRVVEGKVRSTSGVNNINTKELKSLRFLLPSIDEQQEIVRRVRLLMTSFDEIDQMSHSVARSVDLLSPSVLALAFSGGLVEQNPLDEPASELLARLAEAKASENHKPTRRKRQASA
jgi:restriction modification system DNA specificity domain protein